MALIRGISVASDAYYKLCPPGKIRYLASLLPDRNQLYRSLRGIIRAILLYMNLIYNHTVNRGSSLYESVHSWGLSRYARLVFDALAPFLMLSFFPISVQHQSVLEASNITKRGHILELTRFPTIPLLLGRQLDTSNGARGTDHFTASHAHPRRVWRRLCMIPTVSP